MNQTAPPLFDKNRRPRLLLGGGLGAPPLISPSTDLPLGETPPLEAPPLLTRDRKGEADRELPVVLSALAFGAGMGGGIAPALAGSASRGFRASADQRFAEDARAAEQNRRFFEAEQERVREDLQRAELLARSDAREARLDKSAEDLAGHRKSLEDQGAERESRLARAQVVRDLLQLDPEGQQAYLSLLEQSGDLEKLALNFAKRPLSLGEDGQPTAEEWNLDGFRKVTPANLSPEVMAHRAEVEKERANQRRGHDVVSVFSKLAQDPRTTPAARAELLKRIGIVSSALGRGEALPEWVFTLSPDSIREMSPKDREALDNAGVKLEQGQARIDQGRQRIQQGQARLDQSAARSAPSLSAGPKAGPLEKYLYLQDNYRQLQGRIRELGQEWEALGRVANPTPEQVKRRQVIDRDIAETRRYAQGSINQMTGLETQYPLIRANAARRRSQTKPPAPLSGVPPLLLPKDLQPGGESTPMTMKDGSTVRVRRVK